MVVQSREPFISVVLPMCRNIIVTVATLRAIFSWNEYIFSYTFVNTKKNDDSCAWP